MVPTSAETKPIFIKLASDSVKNILFYGLATAFIIGVGSGVRWLGIALFVVDALITILQVASTAFSSVLGVIILIGKVATFRYEIKDLWLHLANLVQLIECGFHVLYFTVMYRCLFVASH